MDRPECCACVNYTKMNRVFVAIACYLTIVATAALAQIQGPSSQGVSNVPYSNQGFIAPGGTTSATPKQRAGVQLNVKSDFGAKGDTVSYVDGTITANSMAFSSASASFTQADVGKKIVIDYAGVAGAPLITRITKYIDEHDVMLTNSASTTTPNYSIWSVKTNANGSGYAPADTISDGTTTFTIDTTQVGASGISIVNGGSGGLTGPTSSSSGQCTVIGTTGSGPQLVSVNVTLTSGVVTAIVGLASAGAYTTNPTNPANEPVSPTGSCTNLTGAILSFNMAPSMVRPTTRGLYTSAPPSTLCVSPACTSSGSGTGVTLAVTQPITGGAFEYGTDDTVALQNAFNYANSAFLSGIKSCVYLPTGSYLIRQGMPTFTSPGCVYGDSAMQTWIVATPDMTGDVLSWSDAWSNGLSGFGFGDGGINNSAVNQVPGPYLANISLYADRTGGSAQNGVMFYDHDDFVFLNNVYIQGFNGYGIGAGLTKNTSIGSLRESKFEQVRVFLSGTPTQAAISFQANNSIAAATAEIRLSNIDIYAPHGDGLSFTAPTGSGSKVGAVLMNNIRIEAQEFDAIQGGNLFVIGSASSSGDIGGNAGAIACFACRFVNPYLGKSAILLDAPNTAAAPFGISIKGAEIVGATNQGNGLTINYGRTNIFEFEGNSSTGPNVTLGVNAGADNEIIAAGGSEASLTYSVAGGRVARRTIVQGTPGTLTDWFDVTYPSGSAALGNTLGSGAFNGMISRLKPNQIPSGIQSYLIGGTQNTAAGQACGVVGGSLNFCTGRNSFVYGGNSGVDKGRFGIAVHPGNALTGGITSQQTDTTVQCTTNSALACTLTADGAAPGSANCINILGNQAYLVEINLIMTDHTQPATNFYSATWNASHTLTRAVVVGSTLFDNQHGTPVLPDTSKSVGAPGSATVDADQVNGCLAVVYTPPGGNTDQMDVTAHIKTVEIQ